MRPSLHVIDGLLKVKRTDSLALLLERAESIPEYPHLEENHMTDNLSVQLYSVRDAAQQDLTAALRSLHDLGLDQVELYGFADDAPRFASALAATGMRAPSAHASLLGAAEPTRVFEAAAVTGTATVIDPMYAPEEWRSLDGVRRIADRLNDLAEQAARFDQVIGYHNHAFELRERIGGRPALEVLADHLDDRVVLEVDVLWAEVGGVPAADLLQRLGARVRFLHVKDGPLVEDDIEQLPAGTGAMDIPAVLAAAPSALRVIEFDDYRGNPFDGIAQSLAYLRSLPPVVGARSV